MERNIARVENCPDIRVRVREGVRDPQGQILKWQSLLSPPRLDRELARQLKNGYKKFVVQREEVERHKWSPVVGRVQMLQNIAWVQNGISFSQKQIVNILGGYCDGLKLTRVIFSGQYEKRLRILDEHLLSTSDLTKFFKELKPSSCRSSVSSESRHLYKNPLLGQALDLLRRGRKEDERGNFGGALVFYESGLASLFDILRWSQIKHEAIKIWQPIIFNSHKIDFQSEDTDHLFPLPGRGIWPKDRRNQPE